MAISPQWFIRSTWCLVLW